MPDSPSTSNRVPVAVSAVGGGCARSFVRLFKPQFAAMVENGTKLQTVRTTPKRMPRVGDTISLRCWTGAPYRSRQRLLKESVITRVAGIEFHFAKHDGMTWWDIAIDGRALDSIEAGAFARADGFASVVEMAEWFEAAHGLPFEGVVIFWHNDKLTDSRP